MKARNRIFLVIIGLSIGLSIGACSIKPITEKSIRATPTFKISFNVDRPYQQVFADFLDNTRECFSRKSTQEQLFVSGQRDNGKKTAYIKVEHIFAKLEHNVHFLIDLTSESKNKTAVTAYTSESGGEDNVMAVKLWADKNNKTCPA